MAFNFFVYQIARLLVELLETRIAAVDLRILNVDGVVRFLVALRNVFGRDTLRAAEVNWLFSYGERCFFGAFGSGPFALNAAEPKLGSFGCIFAPFAFEDARLLPAGVELLQGHDIVFVDASFELDVLADLRVKVFSGNVLTITIERHFDSQLVANSTPKIELLTGLGRTSHRLFRHRHRGRIASRVTLASLLPVTRAQAGNTRNQKQSENAIIVTHLCLCEPPAKATTAELQLRNSSLTIRFVESPREYPQTSIRSISPR